MLILLHEVIDTHFKEIVGLYRDLILSIVFSEQHPDNRKVALNGAPERVGERTSHTEHIFFYGECGSFSSSLSLSRSLGPERHTKRLIPSLSYLDSVSPITRTQPFYKLFFICGTELGRAGFKGKTCLASPGTARHSYRINPLLPTLYWISTPLDWLSLRLFYNVESIVLIKQRFLNLSVCLITFYRTMHIRL